MPRASSVAGGGGGGEDFASSDEVKVYKEEGEDEKRSSENLAEDKLGLVIETEEGKVSDADGRNSYLAAVDLAAAAAKAGAKASDYHLPDLPFGYPLLHPYPYTTTTPSTVSSPNKLLPPPPTHPGLGFYMYGSSPLLQPPPAHMGFPSVSFDLKTGLPRPPLYGLPPGPGHHLLYGTDLSPIHSSAAGNAFRGPFSPMGISNSPLSWFPPPGILTTHPGISHPAVVTCGSTKDLSPLSDSIDNCRNRHRSYIGHHHHHHHPHHEVPLTESSSSSSSSSRAKRNHIKKPLNAFMIFMKEMRQTVIDECTLKESAAINQILGRRWHALERSEQAKYYDMARKEKELHMQLYPGWSARDNYATRTKKKKLKRDPRSDNHSGTSCDEEQTSPDSRRYEDQYNKDPPSDWCSPFWSENENAISSSKLAARIESSKGLFSNQSSVSVSSQSDL